MAHPCRSRAGEHRRNAAADPKRHSRYLLVQRPIFTERLSGELSIVQPAFEECDVSGVPDRLL